jgi:acetyl esterase/lipase
MHYGRLANDESTLATDPRTDPRLVAALKPLGLDGRMPAPPVTADTPREGQLAYLEKFEEAIVAGLNFLAQGAPTAEGVATETTTITGVDDNDITLYITRPSAVSSALPCIVHLHGGGMAFGSATDLGYVRWRENLAATGLVVVGVEFRNSGGKLGPHPYPAGLNDCAAATRWAAAHLTELGASHIVVSGESGGGNLTLAVTLKAKREGWLDEIAGAYAQCPYISAAYAEQPDELPSLKENDGYIFNAADMALNVPLYDPEGKHADDPTCWPWKATDADVAGMPPHAICVNELDPLRDEGLAYYRTLLRAGVPTIGRILPGTCHAGEMLGAGTMSDLYMATVRDISGFAHSLSVGL